VIDTPFSALNADLTSFLVSRRDVFNNYQWKGLVEGARGLAPCGLPLGLDALEEARGSWARQVPGTVNSVQNSSLSKRPASLPAVLGGGDTGRLPEQPTRLGNLTYPSTNRRPISSAMGELPASTTRASASGTRSSEERTRIAATTS